MLSSALADGCGNPHPTTVASGELSVDMKWADRPYNTQASAINAVCNTLAKAHHPARRAAARCFWR